MLTLSINRRLDTPVYEQVADQLRRLVASGALPPGAPLPPVRDLAGDLGLNLNTIARAYRLLEGEGFLLIQDRAGVWVAEPAEAISVAARDRLIAELRTTLARLWQAGMPTRDLLQLVRQEVESLRCSRREQEDE